MKFSIKDFFSKCDQISRKLRIWSYLLKKSLTENFIFCAVKTSVFLFFVLLSLVKWDYGTRKNLNFLLSVFNLAISSLNLIYILTTQLADLMDIEPKYFGG